MPLYDLSEFFSLSRAINYNLSATTSGRFYMLKYITDTKHLSAVETGILMKAMQFLINAYGDKRRRLGPPAVLHPLRAATLFSRASNRLAILDILVAMFHDVFEDIYPFDVENPHWQKIMLEEFTAMLGRLDNDAGQILFDRLILLCRRDDESYYQYIGRILDEPEHADPALRVKLADRLDNTLDMRIDLSDIPEEQGFFQEIFETLFLNVPVRSPLPQVHPPPAPLNGAWRLYELFKSTVLLTLIRQHGNQSTSRGYHQLFHALTVASWNEAKRIFTHIHSFHGQGMGDIRSVLLEAMEYCHTDRINMITKPDGRYRLDGLFSYYFDQASPEIRKARLAELYRDKALMAQASVAFVVIFLSFLQDPDYFIKGISKLGIKPS
ncbi:MAG: hypothetical protein QMD09_08625 [Desulfatibacillaceae bacterium]|nr:hypothetical protein [Desulfatibacillaceae bacterium]